jgi:hypothetical protein
MRRGLLGLLGAVSVLSVVVLWVPQRAGTLVQAIEARRPSVAGAGSATDSDATVRRPLPTTLERMTVEPAQHDPFSDAPTLVATAPVKTTSVLSPSPPAPIAAPPPLQWRLMGTMVTPAGQRLVMLTRGDEPQTVIAEAGVHLDGGYEVAAVTAEAVRLLYRPLQTEVVIPIPPPQAPDR